MTLGKRKIILNSLCHNLILSSNCYICQQCKNKFIADLKFGFICMCVLHRKTLCGLYKCSHSLDYHFMVHRTPKQATCVFHAQVGGLERAERGMWEAFSPRMESDKASGLLLGCQLCQSPSIFNRPALSPFVTLAPLLCKQFPIGITQSLESIADQPLCLYHYFQQACYICNKSWRICGWTEKI